MLKRANFLVAFLEQNIFYATLKVSNNCNAGQFGNCIRQHDSLGNG